MKKILIISNRHDFGKNLAELLKSTGYFTKLAESGALGINLAKKMLPDLVLCELSLPDIDGFEVLRILNQDLLTAGRPLIYIAAQKERAAFRKAMNLGADDFLTEPINMNEILEVVERRLKKHDLLQKRYSKTFKSAAQDIEVGKRDFNLDHLFKENSSKKYDKKAWVFMEGDTANALYFIEKGIVKTFKTTETGKELLTGLNGPGHFLGQLSILSDNGTYIESATVLEDAELHEIPKSDFIALINGNKEVANKFIGLISTKLVHIKEQMINVAYATVRQRLAKTLLDLHSDGFLTTKNDPGITIAREDLAGIIGIATETVIRMLTKFKEEGLISIEPNKSIVILDKKTLDAIMMLG